MDFVDEDDKKDKGEKDKDDDDAATAEKWKVSVREVHTNSSNNRFRHKNQKIFLRNMILNSF